MKPATERYRLLRRFRSLFDGEAYLHRRSHLGDLVACELFEDLRVLEASPKLNERIDARRSVVNLGNRAIGRKQRRGDGTFGTLVPSAVAITEEGCLVGRGPVANIEIGAETKILAKAMIKQIDRVISDLQRQAEHFRKADARAICVAIVGVNHASTYLSFEGERQFPTDGRKNKHPVQEADEATSRILQHGAPAYDELVILPFEATNDPPYPFRWCDLKATEMQYSSALTRICVEYERRV